MMAMAVIMMTNWSISRSGTEHRGGSVGGCVWWVCGCVEGDERVKVM